MGKLLVYYLGRIGILLKRGRYSFYYLNCTNHACSSNLPLTLKELRIGEMTDECIFGWLTLNEAIALIASPLNRMFLLLEDNKPVASCWIQYGKVNLDFLEQYAVLPLDSVYLTHVIVKPSFRGKGAARELLAKSIDLLHQEGIRRVYICCDVRNSAIRKVFHQLGFQFYLGVRHFKISKLKAYLWCNEIGFHNSLEPLNVFPEDVSYLDIPKNSLAKKDTG